MALRDEIKQRRAFGSLEEEAFLNLQRTAQHLDWKWAALLKPRGLSPTQYNALRILRGAGKQGLPSSEIGARMVTQDSDITRLLDRLENRGLVARARDSKDRRVVRVKATRQALDLLARLDGPAQEFVETCMRRLGRKRLRDLNENLERLRE